MDPILCSGRQIERVQNPTLWQSYQLMKKQLEKKNGHTNNERELFHGTAAASIDLINRQGFNRSYAGKHGNRRQHPHADTHPLATGASHATLTLPIHGEGEVKHIQTWRGRHNSAPCCYSCM